MHFEFRFRFRFRLGYCRFGIRVSVSIGGRVRVSFFDSFRVRGGVRVGFGLGRVPNLIPNIQVQTFK